jgi:hypothetical protein
MIRKIKSIIIGILLITTLMSIIGVADIENNIISTLPEAGSSSSNDNNIYPILQSDRNNIFYASNLHDDDNLVYFSPNEPDNFTVIAPSISTSFLAAGCFVEDTWYAVEYYDGTPTHPDDIIWTIDHNNGTMTQVGNYGLSDAINGLAYDDTTGTLYGCNGTNLYIINQSTGSATLVGAMGNGGGVMVGIACDSYGNMYGEDLGDDNFYSIDTSTGAATIIGPLGIDLNYAQDMAYDKDNDTCYITGYKGSANGGGALYTVNLSTGATTLIGDFPIGSLGCPSEVAAFAIPYTLGPAPKNVIITSLEQDWNFVSLPFNQSVDKINVTVNNGGINYTWTEAVTNGYISDFIFGWNRISQGYEFANTFEPGFGYWMFAYVNCDLWTENITIFPDEPGEYITNLSENWNIISIPSPSNWNKSNLWLDWGDLWYNWSGAVTTGLVSDFIFGWNRLSQGYEFADNLLPGYSYWMYSYNTGLILRKMV